MILTEEDAKTKWCPHVRASAFIRGAAVNRQSGFPGDEMNCIASRCSQWRWMQKPNPNFHPMMDAVTTKIPKHLVDETRGYCGLAGKPVTNDPH